MRSGLLKIERSGTRNWLPMPDHVHEWGPAFDNGYHGCLKCPEALTPEQAAARLNIVERLSLALVMSDEEMNAYEWCIERGPKAVDGDYACRLAQYIKNIKLAYAEPRPK